jgi:hypothetical protein
MAYLAQGCLGRPKTWSNLRQMPPGIHQHFVMMMSVRQICRQRGSDTHEQIVSILLSIQDECKRLLVLQCTR